MRIKHVSLKSFTSSTSVGTITFDTEGCAEVTDEQGKFLCQPGLGFKSLEPAPEPSPVAPTGSGVALSDFIPVTGSVEATVNDDEAVDEDDEGEDEESVDENIDDESDPIEDEGDTVDVNDVAPATELVTPASTPPATPKAKAKKKNKNRR